MFQWLVIIIGIAFALFQLFYAYIVICSLIENTGYTIFSIIVGICHAVSPLAFVFWGYQCFWRKMVQYGALKVIVSAVVCFVSYFFVISLWNRIVLGDTPATWKIGFLTAAQVIVTAVFVHGFLYF